MDIGFWGGLAFLAAAVCRKDQRTIPCSALTLPGPISPDFRKRCSTVTHASFDDPSARPPVIATTDLTKTYTFHQQQAGLGGAIKSLVRRTYDSQQDVRTAGASADQPGVGPVDDERGDR